MTIRSRLSACIVLFVVAFAVGIGCATGGDGTTNAGGNCTAPQISCGGACVDPTSDGMNCGQCGTVCPMGQGCSNGMCGACVAPQVQCGTACVVTGTDNKNCGKCGNACGANQVCSNGACGTHCAAGLKTCGGGGADAGSDASPDATTSDATSDGTVSDGATDGTASDAMTPMDAAGSDAAGDGGAGDAGGGPLYCADTQTDPMNCGGCGVSCGPGHACKMGACQLDCPMGKHACPASNLCIPDGTCCTSADCMITGERCSGPGDMCKCPTGQKVCSANNSCIDSAACCVNADCAGIMNSSCPMPGGMCSCPAGKKACPAAGACIDSAQCCGNSDCTIFGEICNGVGPMMGGTCACGTGQKLCMMTMSCIPTTSCCTSADCALTSQVATTTCGGGMCAVATCNAGWVDIDAQYPNGCECQDSGNPRTCATATSLGAIAIGGSTTKTGNLPLANEDNWFTVSFGGPSGPSYHPKVTLSVNPGNQFVFDIASNCGGGTQSCGVESGVANNRTIWEVFQGPPPVGQGVVQAPPPLVGTNSQIWIHVHRASATPTCDSYTLTISN